MNMLELTGIEIVDQIVNQSYADAIQWVKLVLQGERIGMGDERIARFKIAHPKYVSIMFFNHEGTPSEPSFGARNPKVYFN